MKSSQPMKTMIINGQKATINYDEDVHMFRGEFVSLNGVVDFYAKDVKGMGDQIAQTIEHALLLPDSWFDIPHGTSANLSFGRDEDELAHLLKKTQPPSLISNQTKNLLNDIKAALIHGRLSSSDIQLIQAVIKRITQNQ